MKRSILLLGIITIIFTMSSFVFGEDECRYDGGYNYAAGNYAGDVINRFIWDDIWMCIGEMNPTCTYENYMYYASGAPQLYEYMGWWGGEEWHFTICRTPLSYCGDGNVDEDEFCDNGALNGISCAAPYDGSCNYCSTDCSQEITIDGAFCGDGTTNAIEGEECDDGDSDNLDYCRSNCIANICGDNYRNSAEEICDDGNTIDLDGCSADCSNEIECFPASASPKTYSFWAACNWLIFNRYGIGLNDEEICSGELLDYNNIDSVSCVRDGFNYTFGDHSFDTPIPCYNAPGGAYPAAFHDVCREPMQGCGNGALEGSEVCDNGSLNGISCSAPYGGNCSYCSADCTQGLIATGSYCGDGNTNVSDGEECDDGNNIEGDGCSSFCFLEITNELIWQDMNSNEITTTNLGDSIKLVLTNATSGAFEIYEDDPINDDYIANITGSGVGNDLIGVWAITQEYLDKSETGDYDNFVFRIAGNESSELAISIIESNDPTNITILSPKCGSNLSQGSLLLIEISVLDSDDLLTGTLTINGDTVSNLTNGINRMNYTFNEYGNIPLVASVEDVSGNRQRAVSNIMVVNPILQEKYIAACIDEPKNFDSTTTSTVQFKAHSSAAIDCSDGNCQKIPHTSPNLIYTWSFSTCVGAKCDGFVKYGNNSIAYDFTYNYPYPGSNWAKLDLQLN